MRFVSPIVSLFAVAASASAGTVWNSQADWSETDNPNGVWSYLEGVNPLPHVASWQSSLGGWAQPQPGWAKSENANNRIPFFFVSNGSETFPHDFIAGDTVIHSRDDGNGAGNGEGALRWTAPYRCYVRVVGAVWMGRDIGRSGTVSVLVNGATIVSVALASDDPWNRANPRDLNAGTSALRVIQMEQGDTIDLRFVRTSASGDFMGFSYQIEDIGCPPDISLDGEIGFADLNLLLGEFNQTGSGLTADIDDDGDVDFADLNLVLSAFNQPCPTGD